MPTLPSSELVSFNLHGTGLTDTAICSLISAFRVQHIDITNTLATDAVYRDLANESTLSSLSIGGEAVTKECIANLGRSHSIVTLWVHDLVVDDEILRAISTISSIQHLTIDGDGASWEMEPDTDKTLLIMSSCKSLRNVFLLINGRRHWYERVPVPHDGISAIWIAK